MQCRRQLVDSKARLSRERGGRGLGDVISLGLAVEDVHMAESFG